MGTPRRISHWDLKLSRMLVESCGNRSLYGSGGVSPIYDLPFVWISTLTFHSL